MHKDPDEGTYAVPKHVGYMEDTTTNATTVSIVTYFLFICAVIGDVYTFYLCIIRF